MSNPVLSEKQWGDISDREGGLADANAMTVNGTIMKTGLLLVVMMMSMCWMFDRFWGPAMMQSQIMPFMIGGLVGGLILCLAMMFAKKLAMYLGLAYAVCEGLFLGGLTMIFELQYPGLPLIAASFTVATLLGMLFLYRSGIIVASPAFMKGVIGAVIGLGLGVAILWLLSSLFGVGTGIVATLYGNGPIGIGFSILCVGLAALSLVVDFKIIEDGAQNRAPKYMEWVGAFGLLVTLVWLYIEILRLLAKLRSSDD